MKNRNDRTASRGWGRAGLALAAALGALSGGGSAAAGDWMHEPAAARHLYFTGGAHNEVDCEPEGKCLYPRKEGEPTDPIWPGWWTTEWTMYRVFKNYDKFPPPYADPPAGLTREDYQVSYGATYYDTTYKPADGDGEGAMMEHYEKFCLPIFPLKNDFTCSFVSLGNKAYFLTYDDHPKGMPSCCKFSPWNHPPRIDFIKHLPYNAEESTHVDGTIQAYSMQVGPQKILFGYAFNKDATPDSFDPKMTPYRHPQSFYFSGQPTTPPDAPIVTQIFHNFRAEQPDPRQTWEQVAQMCPPDPQWCCLFAGDCPEKGAAVKEGSEWATMNKK